MHLRQDLHAIGAFCATETGRDRNSSAACDLIERICEIAAFDDRVVEIGRFI